MQPKKQSTPPSPLSRSAGAPPSSSDSSVGGGYFTGISPYDPSGSTNNSSEPTFTVGTPRPFVLGGKRTESDASLEFYPLDGGTPPTVSPTLNSSKPPRQPSVTNFSLLAPVPATPLLHAVIGTKTKLRRNLTDEDLLRTQPDWEISRGEIDYTLDTKGQQVVLGEGSLGTVVRGVWRGSAVAIKVETRKDSSKDTRRKEITLMSHMHHPRVVQFLGACTASEPWLVVLEYCPRGTLLNHVKELGGRGVPFPTALKWSLQICQGLRYLHEHKPSPVIHRDLKPSNVLLQGDGIKITDFGRAKMLDNRTPEGLTTPIKTGEGDSSSLGGSYRYMAPEIFNRNSCTLKADIYSLGCVLYYMVTGQPPLSHLPPLEAAKAAATRKERPVFPPSVNKDFVGLVERCWREDANERPTAAAVFEVLQRIEETNKASILAGCQCSVA